MNSFAISSETKLHTVKEAKLHTNANKYGHISNNIKYGHIIDYWHSLKNCGLKV